MNTIRKSVTISRINKDYIDNLIENKKVKNFSRAIDNLIEQDRRQDDRKNDNSSTDAI